MKSIDVTGDYKNTLAIFTLKFRYQQLVVLDCIIHANLRMQSIFGIWMIC